MSHFSGGLRIIDLDDFIAPSQECIKPVKLEKSNDTKIAQIQVDQGGNYIQINTDGSKQVLKKTKIELADCLACSGCVTSAESVLVNQQSVDEFLKRLQATKIFVVSFSPQSRASLAAYFDLDITETNERLVGLFKHLGAKHVFDTEWSNNFTILEMCKEFVTKYKQKQLPVISSSCPGWVCYAEKTCGDYVLPFISTVKSPQAIMGTFVKQYFAKKVGVKPKDILHVTIMSCYDKKLEASREDFIIDENVTEVDIVLTTGEILQILEEKKLDFKKIERVKMDKEFCEIDEQGNLLAYPGGSGGYLEAVFRYAAKELFGVEVKEIKYTQGRNSDFKECSLEVNGNTVLRFCQAYGFRNIQNQVRKIKRKQCRYDFIEIMACPSGCLNGGGQIRPPEKMRPREFLKIVESKFSQHKFKQVDNSDKQILQMYKEWIGGDIYSDNARKILHTQYHKRDQLNINPLTIKW